MTFHGWPVGIYFALHSKVAASKDYYFWFEWGYLPFILVLMNGGSQIGRGSLGTGFWVCWDTPGCSDDKIALWVDLGLETIGVNALWSHPMCVVPRLEFHPFSHWALMQSQILVFRLLLCVDLEASSCGGLIGPLAQTKRQNFNPSTECAPRAVYNGLACICTPPLPAGIWRANRPNTVYKWLACTSLHTIDMALLWRSNWAFGPKPKGQISIVEWPSCGGLVGPPCIQSSDLLFYFPALLL